MSILKYNSTAISPTPVVVIDRQAVGQPDGAFQGIRETWRITGEVLGDSAGAVASAYAALDALFASPHHDLVLYADDGTTVRHQLLQSECLHGVKISKPFAYPKGEGAELATLRSWNVEISGVKLLAGAASGTAWGEYTTTLSVDAQGQTRIVVAGVYHGAGAAAAATARKLAGLMVESEETRTNADTAEVSFSYQYIDAANSRGVISFSETVSIESAIDEVVFRKPLGLGNPIKQTTTRSTAHATQSGQAVGRGAYPTVPSPIWSGDLVRRPRITRSSPRFTKDGQYTEFPVQWDYEFEFVSTPSSTYPSYP